MVKNYTDVQIRKLFPTYFDAAATATQVDEDVIRKILKMYSAKEGGRTYIGDKLKLNQTVVGRIIKKAIKKKILKKVKPSEFKTMLAQKIYESPADREIYNTIREVREIDRITTQKSTLGKSLRKAPSWAKYKIVFATPANLETTVIPKKFQGVRYFKTKPEAQKALDTRLAFSGKDVRKIPFERAVKRLHNLALKDSEVLNNFNKLAQEMYGVAKNTQELFPKQKWLAQDLIKYREFLLGFTTIKDLAAPTAEQLDDILHEFPAENKYRKYGSEAVRQSKFKIRDQLLKTKGPKLRVLRDNIIKYSNTVGRELDEAMGVSATFERAPGYTELGQIIAKEANTAKMTQIDAPFSTIFKRVVEGNRGPINILKNKYDTLDEAIKDFNKVSKNFQKTWKVDTPIIEFKPGEVLDPSKFVKHFDKLSPEAKANVTQLAEKGVALRSRAMPMVGMLYDIYKKSTGADKIAIQKILGCTPGAASGGRIGFATGTLDACVNTKLKNQTLESGQKIVSSIKEGATGVLGKFRNTAGVILGTLGKLGTKAAPLAGLALAGAAIEPLVRKFVIDDPTTYLTDENQQKGMLLSLIEGETPKVDDEILKWQLPVTAAGAASAVPGSAAMMAARKAKGFGVARQALGPLGKVFAGTFSPLAAAITTPLHIAAQRSAGTDYSDIATDPMNWMGAAFAGTGAKMATRGMNPTGILSKALRLGYSPRVLRAFSSKLGWPGLMVTGGMWGYDKWKNRSINDED